MGSFLNGRSLNARWCSAGSVSACVYAALQKKNTNKVLTLQLDSLPSPPAHTIFSVTKLLHQSGLLQVAWLTMGSRACCRISARGPPAGKIEIIRVSSLLLTQDCQRQKVLLTPKTAPASNIAGGGTRQHQFIFRQTGGQNSLGDPHRALKLNQGNVIPKILVDISNHKNKTGLRYPNIRYQNVK